MCGPPDFEALGTCVVHLAGLSAAGLGAYSVHKAASLCRRLRPKREQLRKRTSGDVPAGATAEGPSGQPIT